MAKKAKVKTQKTNVSVTSVINEVRDTDLKSTYKELLKIFKLVTKARPKLWGRSIVGFGEYTYYRSNGDFAQSLATGFSLGKSGPTIYLVSGVSKYKNLLKNLGPHKSAKSCLYLKNLEGIDLDILKKVIDASLQDLKKTHEVSMK